MNGVRGCLLVLLGIFGIFLSIILAFTFYLLPIAFLFFLGSLILISFALGSADSERGRENTFNKEDDGPPSGEK